MPWPTINREMRAHRLPLTSIGWLEDIHDAHNWYGPFLASQYGHFNAVPAQEWGVLDMVSRAVMESDPVKRAEMNKAINQIVIRSGTLHHRCGEKHPPVLATLDQGLLLQPIDR